MCMSTCRYVHMSTCEDQTRVLESLWSWSCRQLRAPWYGVFGTKLEQQMLLTTELFLQPRVGDFIKGALMQD